MESDDDVDMHAADANEELDDTKKRLKEMEDEAAALREMQAKVEKEMGSVQDPATASASQANREEIDFRSVFVGNKKTDNGSGLIFSIPYHDQGQGQALHFRVSEEIRRCSELRQADVSPIATSWKVDSWRMKKALQLPEYPDANELDQVLETLSSFPPIVSAGEARNLEEKLGQAAMGNPFLLQGGDCAESLKEFNANNIRDTFRVLLQMGVVLMFGGQMPVIKVGRMAGQFAKPRSDPFEDKNGVKLPSYRGDNVNGDAFNVASRIPDPQRMVRAYCQSVATLNLLRAFATGGYAAMQRVNQWNLDFMAHSEQGDIFLLWANRYRELAHRVDEALGFMNVAGLTSEHPIISTRDFWTSHECLLLPCEQALTREDSTTGLHYDCSAHMLWVGERTRQLDGSHVEFLRGVANPLGIKLLKGYMILGE
ncbi:phospho-2-dehydro-3-deoxyheptonate aldolase 2, chloroplastic isoform X2 [Vigna radiata var. radiata]|uniref:Phospho-2-dehydro-3-deoxyheptonate aldolase n=1 Tax=Vigna radiata var. radiata TaxID=3916 RepID=A0A3Q0FF47_VIGRR|nr:phospho-2-dehydro-3-deoxyheptonate aldolase 2, chloroplastic isoform X2 [Vigna radiata var. radiata]